jgi:hypothetical protein
VSAAKVFSLLFHQKGQALLALFGYSDQTGKK